MQIIKTVEIYVLTFIHHYKSKTDKSFIEIWRGKPYHNAPCMVQTVRRAAARASRRAGRLRLQCSRRRARADPGCRDTNICSCGPGTTELARLL